MVLSFFGVPSTCGEKIVSTLDRRTPIVGSSVGTRAKQRSQSIRESAQALNPARGFDGSQARGHDGGFALRQKTWDFKPDAAEVRQALFVLANEPLELGHAGWCAAARDVALLRFRVDGVCLDLELLVRSVQGVVLRFQIGENGFGFALERVQRGFQFVVKHDDYSQIWICKSLESR